jgi:DNA polymerase III subunit beta
MHFAVQKDILVRALKDVSSALATRVVQPILSNVLIESQDETAIRLRATDLDLTIESKATGVVYGQGAITLPGKKLLEIVSKLPNELVTIQVNKETLETSITCQRSRFSISGLPADDFPKSSASRSVDGVLMPADILRKSILQTAFAAAGYDVSSILGGVYMVINEGQFECTATDGSRMAHRFEVLNVSLPASRRVDSDKEVEGKAATATLDKPATLKAIIPARACTELVKLIDTQEGIAKANAKQNKEVIVPGGEVRLSVVDSQIVFETENHYLSTRLIGGEYPRYRELFPTEYKHLAQFKRDEFLAAIDRVAVMSDDRTHLIKLHFDKGTLNISANTPDVGQAQEELAIELDGDAIDVAVNVRYVAEVLQRMDAENVKIEMNGSLKPLIIKGINDDNYKYLLMPVQSK